MIVDLYVETTPGNYSLLDMYEDEKVTIKYNSKDSSDIGKVFSTYSQTFNVPMSDLNNGILNYYFDTKVLRNSTIYLNSKIYVNKILFKSGKLYITKGNYKKLKGKDYTLQFFTTIKPLKDIVGDDLLNKMSTVDPTIIGSVGATGTFIWNAANVYNRMTTGTNEDLLVPIASNKRVWEYGTSVINDIKWTSSASTGNKSMELDELRPMIKFKYVMDSIINHYQLSIDCPLFSRPEYTNLYIYGSNNNLATPKTTLDVSGTWTPYVYYPISPGTPTAHGWNATSNTSTDIHTVTWDASAGQGGSFTSAEFRVYLYTELILPTPDVINMEITYVDQRPGREGNILKTISCVDLDPAHTNLAQFKDILQLTPSSFGGISVVDPLIFSVEISANTILTWNSIYELSSATSRASRGHRATYYTKNNASNMGGENGLDYLRAIPEMKVIDFLTSFFKMFNMKVVEDVNSDLSSYGVDLQHWITPQDYTGVEKDYTEYTDIETHTVEPQSTYSKYILTHKQPKYRSNVDWKIANVNNDNSKEFGQLIAALDDSIIKSEYKLETGFSIVPPRLIGDTYIETFYGFDTSSPVVSTTYNYLYKPNFGEFTLFYNTGRTDLLDGGGVPISIGFYIDPTSSQVSTYNQFSITDTGIETTYANSLGFKDEVNVSPEFVCTKNLYSNYYSTTIETLNDNNTRLFTFNCILPPKEVQEFDLRNTVIIGNRAYTIENADIDIRNGKSSIKLLNKPNLNYVYVGVTGGIVTPPVITDTSPPLIPTYFHLVQDTNNISVYWDFASDDVAIKGYEVSYKLSSSGTWITHPFIATSEVGYYMVITGLSYNSFDVRLRVQDTSDNWSINYATDTILLVDATPDGIILSGYTYVNPDGALDYYVSWFGADETSGISYYQISYKAAGTTTYILWDTFYYPYSSGDLYILTDYGTAGYYDFRIRYMNDTGHYSPWVTTRVYAI